MRRLRGGALGGIFSDSIRLSHSRLWITRKNSIGARKHHLRLGCPFLAQRRDVRSRVCFVLPEKQVRITTPIVQFCNLRFTNQLAQNGFGLVWSLRPLWPSQEDRQASLVDPQCIHHTHIHTDNHPSSGANHQPQQPPGYNTDWGETAVLQHSGVRERDGGRQWNPSKCTSPVAACTLGNPLSCRLTHSLLLWC